MPHEFGHDGAEYETMHGHAHTKGCEASHVQHAQTQHNARVTCMLLLEGQPVNTAIQGTSMTIESGFSSAGHSTGVSCNLTITE